jgi:hypothetical protein
LWRMLKVAGRRTEMKYMIGRISGLQVRRSIIVVRRGGDEDNVAFI